MWGENDFLHAFQFNTSTQTLNTTAYATGFVLPPQSMPGGMMTISASAWHPGTGIVWASAPPKGDANQDTAPGNLCEWSTRERGRRAVAQHCGVQYSDFIGWRQFHHGSQRYGQRRQHYSKRYRSHHPALRATEHCHALGQSAGQHLRVSSLWSSDRWFRLIFRSRKRRTGRPLMRAARSVIPR